MNMFFIFIPLALLVLGGIIYFALSPTSSLPVRIAALAALGLIVLSIIVSLGLIFLVRAPGPGDPQAEYPAPVEQGLPQNGSLPALLFFIFLMLALLGTVFVISLRKRKEDGAKDRLAA
ncbi:MAG: hypothetical protein LBP23_00665 [Treponema sp.]|jgi:hypothetical protein|nr:hypothetical protein [Treponema sp.]